MSANRLKVALTRQVLAIQGPKSPIGVEICGGGPFLYVTVSNQKIASTVKISPAVIADYDKDDKLVGFELYVRNRMRAVERIPVSRSQLDDADARETPVAVGSMWELQPA